MSLRQYKKKRDFKKTTEPSGKRRLAKEAPLEFVVQKHNASHLHYDLRLEHDGIMKRWPVPKGPPKRIGDKRLAILVEDHPYEYRKFEGTIPEGEYGAGTVKIWDKGTYQVLNAINRKNSEVEFDKGFEKGEIKLLLHGGKMKGKYVLVRLGKKGDKNWLLIKSKTPSSSRLKQKELARKVEASLKASTKSDKAVELAKKYGAKKKKVKDLGPMLATLSKDEIRDNENMVYEIKYDGYRILADSRLKNPKLISRNGKDFTKNYPPITDEISRLKHRTLLDGEIVVVDNAGRTDFHLLRTYSNKTHSTKLVYYVFDILELEGYDLRKLTLLQRKEILKKVLPRSYRILYSDHIVEKGSKLYKAAKKENLEGIIGKVADSKYSSSKRSKDWLKYKITRELDAVVLGYTKSSSTKGIGALVLGVQRNGQINYIGKVGTGLTNNERVDLKKKFDAVLSDSPQVKLDTKEKVHWINPVYKAEVKYSEWTPAGHLRHPSLVEVKKSKVKVNKPETALKFGRYSVTLTNSQKLLWKVTKVSKREMVDYYVEVADVFLKYLKDRPLTLHRFPNGIDSQSFFQKNVEDDVLPDFAESYQVYSGSSGRYINYIVCNNKPTLAYLANLGTIEFHPWNSRIKSIDNPDYMVFDLDPTDIEFEHIVDVARVFRRVLENLEVTGFVKTSGSKGIHIYVPLGKRYNYEQAQDLSKLIAIIVNSYRPKITTLNKSKAYRKGKILLDVYQNSRGQTVVAPYSLRPKPLASISAPLEWSELTSRLKIESFTIRNMINKLQKRGDIWDGLTRHNLNLKRTLKLIENKYEDRVHFSNA